MPPHSKQSAEEAFEEANPHSAIIEEKEDETNFNLGEDIELDPNGHSEELEFYD